MDQKNANYLADLETWASKIITTYGPALNKSLVPELHELQKRGETLRAKANEKKDDILDDLLPEAFALVREVAHRTVPERFAPDEVTVSKVQPLYVQQIMGAIALHKGHIIEMANGEGKTLTATMPAYLNALRGKGVHIATSNDYLARRDAMWVGQVYVTLGMKVGVLIPKKDAAGVNAYKLEQNPKTHEYDFLVPCSRKEAYDCDITYGTYDDFGFDYLRDLTATQKQGIAQQYLVKASRPNYTIPRPNYIILDEADSVLIDRPRTLLNLVQDIYPRPDGPFGKLLEEIRRERYKELLEVARELKQDEDYNASTLELTEQGVAKAEAKLRIGRLYSTDAQGIAYQLLQSLQALHRYKAGKDYILKEGKIVPLDDAGRPQEENAFPNGLHQAIQVKEGVDITSERVTLTEISYEHFFKNYEKMAGMTATAKGREQEFHAVYGKRVVKIPEHEPSLRKDWPDTLCRDSKIRLDAILQEVKEIHEQNRPILINAQTGDVAEEIYTILTTNNIPCKPLYAKRLAGDQKDADTSAEQDVKGTSTTTKSYSAEEEVTTIRDAGQKGAVTVMAEMAGRGTDIVIDKDVKDKGLHVIGVGKHTSRYKDQQLMGRAGRQGNPGTSHFFLSLDDELYRYLITTDSMEWALEKSGNIVDSDSVNRITITVENIQKRLEEQEAIQRRQAYEFDSILDTQRKQVYATRWKALLRQDLSEDIKVIMDNVVVRNMQECADEAKRIFTERGNEKQKQDLAEHFHKLPSHRITQDDIYKMLLAKRFHKLSNGRMKQDYVYGELNNLKGRKARLDVETWLKNSLHNIYKPTEHRTVEADTKGQDALEDEHNTFGEGDILMRQLDHGWMRHLYHLHQLRDTVYIRSQLEEKQLAWYTLESYKAFWDMLKQVEEGFLKEIFQRRGGEFSHDMA